MELVLDYSFEMDLISYSLYSTLPVGFSLTGIVLMQCLHMLKVTHIPGELQWYQSILVVLVQLFRQVGQPLGV